MSFFSLSPGWLRGAWPAARGGDFSLASASSAPPQGHSRPRTEGSPRQAALFGPGKGARPHVGLWGMGEAGDTACRWTAEDGACPECGAACAGLPRVDGKGGDRGKALRSAGRTGGRWVEGRVCGRSWTRFAGVSLPPATGQTGRFDEPTRAPDEAPLGPMGPSGCWHGAGRGCGSVCWPRGPSPLCPRSTASREPERP